MMSKPDFRYQFGTRVAADLKRATWHPALRRHEHGTGQCAERGNLYVDVNRKGTSHRKARPKVEKLRTGAETSIVVVKLL